jgi:hypothetical protein
MNKKNLAMRFYDMLEPRGIINKSFFNTHCLLALHENHVIFLEGQWVAIVVMEKIHEIVPKFFFHMELHIK